VSGMQFGAYFKNATDGGDDTADIVTKAIGEITTKVASFEGKFASKEDAAALNASFVTLKAAVDDIIKVRERKEDDPKWGYKSFGELAMDVKNASSPNGQMTDALKFVIGKAPSGMSVGSDPNGGFLIPPGFSEGIYDGLRQDTDNLLAGTFGVNVGNNESMTLNQIDETSRAKGSLWGGARAYWMEEAATVSASTMKFRQITLKPHKLGGFAHATEELLTSVATMNSWLPKVLQDSIAFEVSDAVVHGNGAGKPLGLLSSASKIAVAAETQAAGSIVEQNIVKMWARLHPRLRAGAQWLINQELEPVLDLVRSTILNKAGSENVGGTFSNLVDVKGKTIKGAPYKVCEFCEAAGTEGDIILWNPGAYYSATRGTMQTSMSMHLRFLYGESTFRVIYYVDGQSVINTPLTPYKGTNTLSNIVTLAARAG
ncbi:MAG: phage major capsid protein, partial [Candidatus Shapirobacteria bacterium]